MQVGFVTAAVFFIASAAVLIGFANLAGEAKTRFLTLGVLYAVAGVAATALLFMFPNPMAFLLLVAIWAIAAAGIEFSATKTQEENGAVSRLGRDWRTLAIGTAFFGLLMAFSPFIGIADEVSLTGLFGAYAAIAGVYHAIAAASLAFGGRVTGEQASRSMENES